jgi:hypothetical protein
VFINRKGKCRDGSEKWEAHYFCVDVKNALVALVKLRMRLIDSSVPDEIKAAIRGDYELVFNCDRAIPRIAV